MVSYIKTLSCDVFCLDDVLVSHIIGIYSANMVYCQKDCLELFSKKAALEKNNKIYGKTPVTECLFQ